MGVFSDQVSQGGEQCARFQLDLLAIVHAFDPLLHHPCDLGVEIGKEVRISRNDVLIAGEVAVLDQVDQFEQFFEEVIR
ncbi:hypothetical protein D9M68_964780 [compost metagenome]